MLRCHTPRVEAEWLPARKRGCNSHSHTTHAFTDLNWFAPRARSAGGGSEQQTESETRSLDHGLKRPRGVGGRGLRHWRNGRRCVRRIPKHAVSEGGSSRHHEPHLRR